MRTIPYRCGIFFKNRTVVSRTGVLEFLALTALACQLVSLGSAGSERLVPKVAVKNPSQLPVGCILPAKLTKALSAREAKAGDTVEAEITQEVPLPDQAKIAFRSAIDGIVLGTRKDQDGQGVELDLRFSQVSSRDRKLPAVMSLRAMASYMAVAEAQTPLTGADTGSPAGWANTVQIGGDVRYGDGGPVRTRYKEKVGKGVRGGVLVYVRANPDKGCQGPVRGDKRLQALWVFSADACGAYGLTDVEVIRTGEAAPLGIMTLHFKKADKSLAAGTGLLLRVESVPGR
jgi:hypothetical protein